MAETALDISRIEKFESFIEDVDYFIEAPSSFLYDQIEDPESHEIVECLKAIIGSNINILNRKKEEILRLRKIIMEASPVQEATQEEQSVLSEEPNTIEENQRDLTEFIKLLLFSNLESSSFKVLESLSKRDIVRLKLYFLKQIIITKQEIKNSIMANPIFDIRELQKKLNTYEIIITFINEITSQKEQAEEQEHTEISNIIFVPNSSKQTYFFEDVERYLDNRKEIKLIFDKLVDGYFLKTKDTKPIEINKTSHLYEYKHPNGIRILYIVEGSYIYICSLFYKDKQRSIRIDNYYDEAVRRFNNSKEYMLANLDNSDFYIEQAELVGQINSLLEGPSLIKKVGDSNE